MKILLINPPNCGRSIPEERYDIDDSIKMKFRGGPMALESLAADLEGHQAAIVESNADSRNRLPDALRFDPDLACFTGITNEADTLLQIAKDLNSRFETNIVFAGHHATCNPEFYKDFDNTIAGDFIVSMDDGHDDFLQQSGISLPMPGTPLQGKMKNRINDHDQDYDIFTDALIPTRMGESAFREI